jgi:4'-phosphopantetheinyl transferase
MSIATRYFSPEELAWLAPMPREEQVFGFYRLWAVKEAFLKAVGTGLATPLTEVSVRFGPAPRARVLRNDGVEYSPTYSEELNLADGYSAAVVVNAIHSDVRLHRLNSHRR